MIACQLKSKQKARGKERQLEERILKAFQLTNETKSNIKGEAAGGENYVCFINQKLNQTTKDKEALLLDRCFLTAVQGPNPNSVSLFLSSTQKANNTQSYYAKVSFSLRSKDPTQIHICHLISFPDPKNQQHPSLLLNIFLLTAAQRPNPDYLYIVVHQRGSC